MFARGAERRLRPSPGLASNLFRCSKCAAPLELERVLGVDVERGPNGVTGYVVFQHHCPCTPDAVRASRSWATHAAFVALFGSQPWLPYRSPFRFEAVADDDPLLGRWRWELEQVADAHEFLLFLDDGSGGRSAA
ncbi:MAG TPA: hypothetical protein VG455_07570 [Acidimicrobiales bacterium]|nr:hypothetical protein [Acidimicrobiales bacterium]